MTGKWQTSNRRRELPPNWNTIRQQILHRDQNRCRHCGQPANQVDHIDPGDNHTPTNLQSLCQPCHANKSAAEGNATPRDKRQRPPDPHPSQTVNPPPAA